MSDAHKLAQLMREAGKTPQNEVVDIVVGEVTSVSPIKVKVENRELTQSFLIIGALCQATYIRGDAFTFEDSSTPTPTKVRLWRGLKTGDRVLMLKVGRGQKYYIIQREEGVGTE